MERFLDGIWDKWVSVNGELLDHHQWWQREIMEALVHCSYVQSNQTSILVDIQGIHRLDCETGDHIFELSDPAFATLQPDAGLPRETDAGPGAIN